MKCEQFTDDEWTDDGPFGSGMLKIVMIRRHVYLLLSMCGMVSLNCVVIEKLTLSQNIVTPFCKFNKVGRL